MSGEWFYVDEFEKLIFSKYKAIGNYFKSHALTFFSKDESKNELKEALLNFCLLEITTFLDATAIGEIFIYSHQDDEIAKKKVEQYKAIINKVKAEFNNKSISAYKEWYKKQTYIYIRHNPDGNFKRSKDHKFKWNLDGEKQNENKERKDYCVLEGSIEDDFISEYINYYIQLLEKDLTFSNYQNYGVIIKPLALPYQGEMIPIGNVYLHFATEIPYTKDDYTNFINEFTKIYLIEKGGRVIKEIVYKASQADRELPPWLPNFTKHGTKKYHTLEIIDVLYYLFTTDSDKFMEQYLEKCKQLKQELLNCFFKDSKFNKVNVDREETKKYPLIELILSKKTITTRKVSKLSQNRHEVALIYLLYRNLALIMLLAFELSPADVHNFVYNGFFDENYFKGKKTVYYFFLSKFSLFVKEDLTDNPLTDPEEYNNVLLQASGLEKGFIADFKDVFKKKAL